VPIYAVLYVASLEAGFLRGLSAVVGLLALAGFGQFAIYRARRYRLTRTVFRGLRFHQGGSAVHYAVRAMLWWIPTVITLGLAAPWATADLERYKMRNTFYGKLGGSFAASGGRLFMRGVLIWILIVAPVVVGLVAAASMANWPDVMRAMSLGTVGRAAGALPADDRVRIWLGIGGVSLSFIFGIVLYPAYQAIAMRWWLGGLRLGGVTIATDLLTRRYYFAYLRYLGDVVLYTLVMGIVASFVIFVGAILNVQFRGPIDISGGASPWDNRLIFGSYIALYVIYALGVSTIYQVWIKMRLWRVAVESMLISGIAALDHVQAGEATSSAVGEGLADALGTGAI
jgi:hypothetical protein